jgi:hypothetical protein
VTAPRAIRCPFCGRCVAADTLAEQPDLPVHPESCVIVGGKTCPECVAKLNAESLEKWREKRKILRWESGE